MISRILNHPELCFNQRLLNDLERDKRFFLPDAEMSWKMSVRNECFICDKYQYGLIFYQRGNLAVNPELNRVNDEEILAQLRYEYMRNKSDYRTDAPLIAGSIVNHGLGYHKFERKLKMVRTPLFALLSVV